ncbi:unnamed protein product, partial [Mesorhabditis spiculigera]
MSANSTDSTESWPTYKSSHAADLLYQPWSKFEQMRNAITPNPTKSRILMGAGDPTANPGTPRCRYAAEALIRAVQTQENDGYLLWSGGIPAREAIAEHYSSPTRKLTAENVIMTIGGGHGLELIIQGLAEPGENVLFPKACYKVYETYALAYEVKFQSYKLNVEDGLIDLVDLEKQINPKTKAIFVTNPHNPLGTVYPKEHLEDLLRIARKHRLPIVSDEIYGKLTFGAEFYPLAELEPKVPIITVDALSKAYLVPGWRCGWLILDDYKNCLAEAWFGMRQLTLKTIGPCSVVQAAIPDILKNTPKHYFTDLRATLKRNAELFTENLKNIPGIKPIHPSGAIYYCAKLDQAVFGADIEFMCKLLEAEAVTVMPGSLLGLDGHFRALLLLPEAAILDACERIQCIEGVCLCKQFHRYHAANGTCIPNEEAVYPGQSGCDDSRQCNKGFPGALCDKMKSCQCPDGMIAQQQTCLTPNALANMIMADPQLSTNNYPGQLNYGTYQRSPNRSLRRRPTQQQNVDNGLCAVDSDCAGYPMSYCDGVCKCISGALNAGSTCVSGGIAMSSSTCSSGQIYVAEAGACMTSQQPGEPCQYSQQCSANEPGAFCLKLKCECVYGMQQSGPGCTFVDSQCPQRGFIWISELGACKEVIPPGGKGCSHNLQCQGAYPDATCFLQTCSCPPDFPIAIDGTCGRNCSSGMTYSGVTGQCLPTVQPGDQCLYSSQCHAIHPGMICDRNRCTCSNGQVFSGNQCTEVCPQGYRVNSKGVCSPGCTPTQIEFQGECLNQATPGQSCLVNAQCTGGASCQNGVCVCPLAMVPSGGACMPVQAPPLASCLNGEQCTGGSFCVSGNCSCPLGQSVLNGQCVTPIAVPPNSPCNPSVSCGGGSSCVSNVCQCPASQVVVDEICTLPPAVNPGGPCPSGMERCLGQSSCINGACTCPFGTTIQNAQCIPIAAASPGSPCGSASTCHGLAVCIDGMCKCPFGMTIQNGECRAAPTASVGSSCANDETCVGGSLCIGAICSCPTGSRAIQGVCTAIASVQPGQTCSACVCEIGQTPTGECIITSKLRDQYKPRSPQAVPKPFTNKVVVEIPRRKEPLAIANKEMMRQISTNSLTNTTIPKSVDIGSACVRVGVTCAGGSVCVSGLCVCPLGTIPHHNQCVEHSTVNPGESCARGEECTGGSQCNDRSLVCECTNPLQIIIGGRCENRLRSHPGYPCGNGEVCVGGSECVDGRCQCTNGRVNINKQCIYRPDSKPGALCGNGERCTGNSECDQTTKKCTCPRGMASIEDVCTAFSFVFPGESCMSLAARCGGQSYCVRGTCQCAENMVPLNGKCTRVKQALPGTRCSAAENCVGRSACRDGQCVCMHPLVLRGHRCDTPRNVAPGESCRPGDNCLANSACKDNFCMCPVGQIVRHQRCEPRRMVRPTYTCSKEDICTGFSTCQNNVCVCQTGQTVVDDKCVDATTALPGQECGRNVICSGGAQCIGDMCVCGSDQRIYGNKCQDIIRVGPEASCAKNEVCTGGSTCDRKHRICRCPNRQFASQGKCVPISVEISPARKIVPTTTTAEPEEEMLTKTTSGVRPTTFHRYRCYSNDDCKKYGSGSVCRYRICACPAGMVMNRQRKCEPAPDLPRPALLHRDCTSTSQCAIANSVCEQGQCICIPGYRIFGGTQCILRGPPTTTPAPIEITTSQFVTSITPKNREIPPVAQLRELQKEKHGSTLVSATYKPITSNSIPTEENVESPKESALKAIEEEKKIISVLENIFGKGRPESAVKPTPTTQTQTTIPTTMSPVVTVATIRPASTTTTTSPTTLSSSTSKSVSTSVEPEIKIVYPGQWCDDMHVFCSNGSTCVLNTCQCRPDLVLIEQRCIAPVEARRCIASNQCPSGAECVRGRCVCPSGMALSRFGFCLSIVFVDPGMSCADGEQCRGDSTCVDGICACNEGLILTKDNKCRPPISDELANNRFQLHAQDQDSPHVHANAANNQQPTKRMKRQDPLITKHLPGESCSGDVDCINPSLCLDTFCRCPPSHFQSGNVCIDKNAVSSSISLPGDHCSQNDVCDGGAVCVNHVCKCPAAMVPEGPFCFQVTAKSGQSCSNGELCLNGSLCIEGTCSCPTGFNDVDGQCIKKKIARQNIATSCIQNPSICPGGSYCGNGICVCPYGQSFINGICTTNSNTGTNVQYASPGAACVDGSTRCLGNSICINSFCICPGGEQIRNGMCVAIDSDASPGEMCQTGITTCTGNSYCTNNICRCQSTQVNLNGQCSNVLQASVSNCQSCPSNSQCVRDQCQCNNGYQMSSNNFCLRYAYPGQQCDYSSTCQSNSACQNSICTCNSGYTMTQGLATPSCVQAANPGEFCSSNLPCGSNSQCLLGQCACNQGYAPSNNGAYCAEIVQANQACGQQSICVANSQCSNAQCNPIVRTISCQPGFTYDQTSQQCIRVVALVASPQENCGLNPPCAENSYCNQGQCSCNNGYYYSSSSQPNCQPFIQANQPCQQNSVCVQNSACNSGTCQCNNGYQYSNGNCMANDNYAHPGQSCGNGQICQGGSRCDGTVCRCPFGFFPAGQQCVPANQDPYISITIVPDNVYQLSLGSQCEPRCNTDANCNQRCGYSSICSTRGLCTCPVGYIQVGNSCVNNGGSSCGACGTPMPGDRCNNTAPCGGGSVCVLGICACPPGYNPSIDGLSCEQATAPLTLQRMAKKKECSKDTECSGGMHCVSKTCICPRGTTLIDGKCASVMSSGSKRSPVYPGSFCANTPQCQKNSQCFLNRCVCVGDRMTNSTGHCVSPFEADTGEALPGSRCTVGGPPCMGDSICDQGYCVCPLGTETTMEPYCSRTDGEPPLLQFAPNSEALSTKTSCSTYKECKSPRVCGASKLCECPFFMREDERGVCVLYNDVAPGKPCDYPSARCANGSECVQNLCACKSGLTLTNGVCMADSRARPGELCMEGVECDHGAQCINNICKCPIGITEFQKPCKTVGKRSVDTNKIEDDLRLRPPTPTKEVLTDCPTDGSCKLPDCFCSRTGSTIPGNLSQKETPQIIILTFDDPVTDRTINIYKSLLDGRIRNPNGCAIKGTFFISHQWNNYDQTQWLYSRDNEIGVNSITHETLTTATEQRWRHEMGGLRESLKEFSYVEQDSIKGIRAPQLLIGGDNQFTMMQKAGFTYDNSIPLRGGPYWPQTLDHKMAWDCEEQNCPTKPFKGLWEIPIHQLISTNGKYAAMARSAIRPFDSRDGVANMLKRNFLKHYKGNRAPFVITADTDFLTILPDNGAVNALSDFLNDVLNRTDVYVVTASQAIEWMKKPTKVAEIERFAPWQCQFLLNDHVQPCESPSVCTYSASSLQGGTPHSFRVCGSCPLAYPWIENPLGKRLLTV